MRAFSSALMLLLVGCPSPQVPEEILGDLGEVVPYATDEQRQAFERGLAVVQHRFTPEEGLGPHFNLTFCGGCHERPVFGGSAPRYRDFLLVQQVLSDGTQQEVGVNGVQPNYHLESRYLPSDPAGNLSARRNAIGFFGIGLLAEIPEASILAHADPDDRDGDGIRGRPNFDRGFVGRFGRKSQTVSIEGFIRGPLFNHLGITSNPLSDALKAQLPVPSALDDDVVTRRREALHDGDIGRVVAAQAAAPDEPTVDDDGVPDPELSEQELFDLISFAMLLAAPRPDPPTEETLAGEAVFHRIACASCHVPALEGPRGLVPAYSDLLIHDMGEALADGIVMGEAGPRDFRTQPLWGVVATGPYLHDGRADTLDEAIRWHGGEARASREAYEALEGREREQVLAFLRSLGGASQTSPGLLPPNAPMPATGEPGGPRRALSADEATRFERGRELFDRDFLRSEGLGPNFNGDSCRACHFDPVIGGAGPADVDVIRQARLDDEGTVSFPTGGTMLHRFDRDPIRPAPDPTSNLFERRQTPSLFGAGLLDAVPDEIIIANADPEDENGDGVRGRAAFLDDGRLGRFGWRADVPSLEEFVRDALSMELGVTVPAHPEHTFGILEDDDGVPDPEITDEDMLAIELFMRELSPPTRTRSDPALEDRGEAVFEEVGCRACHLDLALTDGTPVLAYTDLLLHDVSPEGRPGIGGGAASGREFRTPPLWGIADTAPYMHDGSASTLEAAIAAHDGEAAAAARAVAALDLDARRALLAFLRSL